MGIVSGTVVYIMVWWLVLFMVLPWGVQHAEEPEAGHESGAPVAPRMWLKVLVTTVIATIIWFAIDIFIISDLFSFRET